MEVKYIYATPSNSGAILRRQRTNKNLTQRQVALRAGITIRQYQNFESDARNIMTASFILACRILEALELDIGKFYRGEYDDKGGKEDEGK